MAQRQWLQWHARPLQIPLIGHPAEHFTFGYSHQFVLTMYALIVEAEISRWAEEWLMLC